MRCYGCGETGHRVSNYPKVEWNWGKNVQGEGPRNPSTTVSQGHPPDTGPAKQKRNFMKPQAGGRVYRLEAREEETEDPHAVVLGTLLINYLSTWVLFDVGGRHSFINFVTAKRLSHGSDEMDMQLCVATRVGSIFQTESVVRNCPITIHDKVFPIDLVWLEMQVYDVILGMDWLAKYKATIDCQKMLLTLTTPEGEKIECWGSNL